jgi:hypothetical protein
MNQFNIITAWLGAMKEPKNKNKIKIKLIALILFDSLNGLKKIDSIQFTSNVTIKTDFNSIHLHSLYPYILPIK